MSQPPQVPAEHRREIVHSAALARIARIQTSSLTSLAVVCESFSAALADIPKLKLDHYQRTGLSNHLTGLQQKLQAALDALSAPTTTPNPKP